MIYTKTEKEQFEQSKTQFKEYYIKLLERMLRTFDEKAKKRDVGSPIHHRQSPQGMLAIAQAKCRRTDALLSLAGWENDSALLDAMIEECVDGSNYLLYIAALCSMLLAEEV